MRNVKGDALYDLIMIYAIFALTFFNTLVELRVSSHVPCDDATSYIAMPCRLLKAKWDSITTVLKRY